MTSKQISQEFSKQTSKQGPLNVLLVDVSGSMHTYKNEIKRIVADNPSARVIVVGHEFVSSEPNNALLKYKTGAVNKDTAARVIQSLPPASEKINITFLSDENCRFSILKTDEQEFISEMKKDFPAMRCIVFAKDKKIINSMENTKVVNPDHPLPLKDIKAIIGGADIQKDSRPQAVQKAETGLLEAKDKISRSLKLSEKNVAELEKHLQLIKKHLQLIKMQLKKRREENKSLRAEVKDIDKALKALQGSSTPKNKKGRSSLSRKSAPKT